jgi:cytochrome c-type biogenesis protein CcsB
VTSNPSLAQLADTLAWLTVLTYLAADRVPWGNLYEVSVLLGLLLVAAYLVWAWRRPETRSLGPFVLLPAVLAIAAGGLLAYVPVGPLVPALNSGWLRIQVAAAIVGCSTLALSGLFSLLFLGKDRVERRARPRPPLVAGGAQTADRAQVAQRLADHIDTGAPVDVEAAGVPSKPRRSEWRHLPAAQTLDELAYRTTAFAFPIWTFGIIAGAIWGQAAWGRYWGWDPKETWSFIVWVLYAAYLHARATAGWRGRRAAWISAIGLAAIAFNVYAVNLWLAGLHSYAT